MFGVLLRKRDWIRILVGFAPNLATPQLILSSPRYYAWWLDEFLGNFSKKRAEQLFDKKINYQLLENTLSDL
jgi:hypothetical protein